MNKSIFTIFIAILFYGNSSGQPVGIDLLGGKMRVDIPFKYNQGFILVDVEIDKTLPLKFIFDTGAEHTIMFHKIMADLIDMNYTSRIRILGADISNDVHALIARNIYLNLKKGETIQRDILVLEEEISKLREAMGEEIGGILGTSVFKSMVVKIDYQKSRITLMHPLEFNSSQETKGYQEYDIEVIQNKAYIKTPITLLNGNKYNSTLLVDTGAAIPLLLHTNTDSSLVIPDIVIDGRLGFGLGGPIKGFLGKIKRLDLQPHSFDFPLTSFQDIDLETFKQSEIIRNGILGNKLLSRFDVIIDFFKRKLYLKPRKNYGKEFKYDLSGLEIVALGREFRDLEVRRVVKNSPAARAGIKAGDKIKKVGFIGTKFYSLERLVKKLESKPGKKIRLKIERNGKTYIKKFVLRDLFDGKRRKRK